MDVSDQLAEIPFALTEDRLIAALEKMPGAMILSVVVLTVRRKKPLHDHPDRVRPAFDQQVYVVGHQAIGIKEERKACFLFFKQREELFVVFRRMEDVLPRVTACDQMIKPAICLDPRFPRHHERL